MVAVCARCQKAFQTDRYGRQYCPSCGQEVFLPPPEQQAGGWVQPQAPLPGAVYGAPQGPPVQPGVRVWLQVYCWFNVFVWLCGVLFGVAGAGGAFNDGRGSQPDDLLAGVFIILFSVLFAILHALTALLKPSPVSYWMGVAVSGLSLLCGCWPAGIALLIFLLKPEARRWYEAQAR